MNALAKILKLSRTPTAIVGTIGSIGNQGSHHSDLAQYAFDVPAFAAGGSSLAEHIAKAKAPVLWLGEHAYRNDKFLHPASLKGAGIGAGVGILSALLMNKAHKSAKKDGWFDDR